MCSVGSGTRLREQGEKVGEGAEKGEGEDESAEGNGEEQAQAQEGSATTSGRRRIAREHLGLVRVRGFCMKSGTVPAR